MAFVSTKSQIKNNILNYIRHLVTKTLYRAIEILFRPCCDIAILGVKPICSSTPGTYDVTITLDKSINMLGNGLMMILVGNTVATVAGNTLIPYNDGKTITIEGLNIGTVAGVTEGVSILFLLPAGLSTGNTNINDLTPGSFVFSVSEDDFTFPPCI
jgi:hypothetical protein